MSQAIPWLTGQWLTKATGSCTSCWEGCVSREHELLTKGIKDPSLNFGAGWVLETFKKDTVEPCSTSKAVLVTVSCAGLWPYAKILRYH